MLAIEQLDIAVIAAASSGAHSYLEKPIAVSLAEVDHMLAVCKRSGSLLVVAHP